LESLVDEGGEGGGGGGGSKVIYFLALLLYAKDKHSDGPQGATVGVQ